MSDVPICDGVIASVMPDEQSGADGVSQLTGFLNQKEKEANWHISGIGAFKEMCRR
jgi:predicted DNA-binding protein with PD1-like motif